MLLILFSSRVDASKEDGSFGRLLNDDHIHPNCRPKVMEIDEKPVICFFSLRPLSSNTELVYDYGPGNIYPWRGKVITPYCICSLWKFL